jgi:hypothetical protein
MARRRMLTMLVTLTCVAMLTGVTGLAAWWVVVPPLVMLGLYMTLLREAARADTERLHRSVPATAATDRATRPVSEPEQGPADVAADTPPPSAQIIDISARVQDELYDQYADAARRAVGD